MGKLTPKLNSKGVTLVEILAVLVLASLIITLVTSIVMLGKNTFGNQTFKADSQDTVTFAMKEITKEIRSSQVVIIHKDEKGMSTDKHEYRFLNNKIYKDNIILVENIEDARFTDKYKGGFISISIDSIDNQFSLSTNILVRE